MDKNSINDRFIESVNYLISNKLVVNKIDLAESLGIGNTKLSEILNKRMKAGTDLIACLCYKYSINSDWILIGRGSMLPNEQPQQLEQAQSTDQSQIVQIFVSQLEKKDEEIKSLNLQIAKVFKVTERTVQSAMRFETQSPTARILRAYALNHGAEQYEVTTIKKKVENPYRETIKL